MFDKSKKKKNKKEKIVITKRSLYVDPLFSLIKLAILLALFMCGLILLLIFWSELPLWCSILTVTVFSILILYLLFELYIAAKNISTIKKSEIIITDAIVVNKYKKLSTAADDFSDNYFIKFKGTDESIIELEIDLCLYEKVVIGSSCYHFNISNSVYPKDYYLLGDDLLEFYKSNVN